MEDCIFCKIVRGDIPCFKIYEDDKVLAFLDIQPLSKGHTLVLPKGHHENIFDTPSDIYGHMYQVAKKIAEKIKDEYKPTGILINQNNGKSAGQYVFHAHVHIKPMYNGTPVFDESNHRKKLSEEEMKSTVNDLTLL